MDKVAKAAPPGIDGARNRSIVATLGPYHKQPWWWEHLRHDRELCPLSYERMVYRNKKSQDVSLLELPLVMLMVLFRLLRWRNAHDYLFTFECDLVGLSVAFWQSLLRMTKPRHVVLQFIMREREATFRSNLKYGFMRFLFSSVNRVIVSSSAEAEYYTRAFNWPRAKARFVPLHTDPDLVDCKSGREGDYILAAGRTFRDYETLVSAVSATGYRAIIVGGSGTRSRYGKHKNIEILENIPQSDLRELMLNARVVVVPLEDRKISSGQSVILEAMGIGKAVIATSTAGTVDYIEHMVNGILVPPGDVTSMQCALETMDSQALRARLGNEARKRVLKAGLPHHYSSAVRCTLFPG
jgi:glycosyltransferase involved in cell wall biosynthesis